MNLIEDVFIMENMQILNEGRGTGPMKIRGCFQRADEENNNKRIYPKALLQREMDKLSDAITERRLMGELDHPQHDSVKLNNVSHLITKLEMKGNEVIGEAEILNTPAGQVVKALIEGGVKVGISSRGLGTLSEGSDGKRYVNEDFKLVTWDMVADPSTRGAYPGLTESTEINRIIEDVLPRANKVENFKVILREEFDRIDEKKKKKKKSKKAARDYDGDGEVESGTEEWKGSRDKAIKRAMSGREEESYAEKVTAAVEAGKDPQTPPSKTKKERDARMQAAKEAGIRARSGGGTRGHMKQHSSTDLNLHGLLHSIKEAAAKRVGAGTSDEYVSKGKTGATTLPKRLLKKGTKKASASAETRVKTHAAGPKGLLPDSQAHRDAQKDAKNAAKKTTSYAKLRQSTDLNLHGLLHSIKEMRDKTHADQIATVEKARLKTFKDARKGKGRRSPAQINAAALKRENEINRRQRRGEETINSLHGLLHSIKEVYDKAEGRDEEAPRRRKTMPGRRKPVGAKSGDHQKDTMQSTDEPETVGKKTTTSGAPRGTRGRPQKL